MYTPDLLFLTLVEALADHRRSGDEYPKHSQQQMVTQDDPVNPII
jgi:hypothetical protein